MKLYLDFILQLLPAVAQVLLAVAAIVAAWKGRGIAKEKTREKRKDP